MGEQGMPGEQDQLVQRLQTLRSEEADERLEGVVGLEAVLLSA